MKIQDESDGTIRMVSDRESDEALLEALALDHSQTGIDNQINYQEHCWRAFFFY